MQKYFLLLLVILFASCNYFQSQEKLTAELVALRLNDIDWTDVDSYPLFDPLYETASKEEQLEYFRITMFNLFSEALEDISFVVDQDINEVMFVDFEVDEHGFILFKGISENEVILKSISNIKEELSNRLNEITTVAPALKRAKPVSIKFRLPLVLNTNN